jgi:hypothetical protein
MFIQPHMGEYIRSKIAEFRDQNSYEKPTWRAIIYPHCDVQTPSRYTYTHRLYSSVEWLQAEHHGSLVMFWNDNSVVSECIAYILSS